jgi:hypothetical protein
VWLGPSDFESLVEEEQMWKRLSMYMEEQWLVGAAVVAQEYSTEKESATGLLNVRCRYIQILFYHACC